MELYFITGNKNKFEEARQIVPELQQLDIDLLEIQEIDAHKIIEEKLKEALKHKAAGFIVEDTSLYLDALHGLPGPLIKWFMKTMGNEGISNMAEKLGNAAAAARCIIGYARAENDTHFFKESLGNILDLMGFEKIVEVQKIRRKANYNDIEICMDEVAGLGSFIEVEKFSDEPGEKIKAELWTFLKSLGVAEADRIMKGYDTLIYEKTN